MHSCFSWKNVDLRQVPVNHLDQAHHLVQRYPFHLHSDITQLFQQASSTTKITSVTWCTVQLKKKKSDTVDSLIATFSMDTYTCSATIALATTITLETKYSGWAEATTTGIT
jgi:hypothetical protein